MNDLTNFVAHLLQYGLNRKNRFRVTLPLPPKLAEEVEGSTSELNQWVSQAISTVRVMRGGLPKASRGLQIMCSSAQLPGVNITTEEGNQNGHRLSVATGAAKDELKLDFLLSRDMAEFHALEMWRNLIVNRLNGRVGYYDDYVTDLQIDLLDEFDNVVTSTLITEAFPILFSALEYERSSTDEINTYSTSWAYKTTMRPEDDEKRGLTDGTTVGGILDDLSQGNVAQAVYNGRKVAIEAKKNGISSVVGKDVMKMVGNIVDNFGPADVDISGALEDLGIQIEDGVIALDDAEKKEILSLIQNL